MTGIEVVALVGTAITLAKDFSKTGRAIHHFMHSIKYENEELSNIANETWTFSMILYGFYDEATKSLKSRKERRMVERLMEWSKGALKSTRRLLRKVKTLKANSPLSKVIAHVRWYLEKDTVKGLQATLSACRQSIDTFVNIRLLSASRAQGVQQLPEHISPAEQQQRTETLEEILKASSFVLESAIKSMLRYREADKEVDPIWESVPEPRQLENLTRSINQYAQKSLSIETQYPAELVEQGSIETSSSTNTNHLLAVPSRTSSSQLEDPDAASSAQIHAINNEDRNQIREEDIGVTAYPYPVEQILERTPTVLPVTTPDEEEESVILEELSEGYETIPQTKLSPEPISPIEYTEREQPAGAGWQLFFVNSNQKSQKSGVNPLISLESAQKCGTEIVPGDRSDEGSRESLTESDEIRIPVQPEFIKEEASEIGQLDKDKRDSTHVVERRSSSRNMSEIAGLPHANSLIAPHKEQMPHNNREERYRRKSLIKNGILRVVTVETESSGESEVENSDVSRGPKAVRRDSGTPTSSNAETKDFFPLSPFDGVYPRDWPKRHSRKSS